MTIYLSHPEVRDVGPEVVAIDGVCRNGLVPGSRGVEKAKPIEPKTYLRCRPVLIEYALYQNSFAENELRRGYMEGVCNTLE